MRDDARIAPLKSFSLLDAWLDRAPRRFLAWRVNVRAVKNRHDFTTHNQSVGAFFSQLGDFSRQVGWLSEPMARADLPTFKSGEGSEPNQTPPPPPP